MNSVLGCNAYRLADLARHKLSGWPLEFSHSTTSNESSTNSRSGAAFGNEVWSDEVGSVSGSATVSVVYAGPALEAGLYYQFRVLSFRERNGPRTAISATEDLRGVFFLPAD